MFSTGCWSNYEGDTYDVITKKEDLEGLFRCIEANILVKQKEIEELRKELKEVKAEKYKDEEIQKLQKKCDDYWAQLRLGFGITEAESKQISAWQKKHDATEHKNPDQYHGTSGGGYSYKFYPTAIGTFGSCVCDICHRRATDMAYASGKYDQKKYPKYMEVHNGSFNFDDV